jgi:chaperonin cofactor prefoldin
MYLLGQVKKNKAPDRVSNLMKEDLIRFEAMIKTINFTKLRNLDTVESVERYKDKCFDTIALIKREQGQIKNDELSRLFGALVDRSRYARAYSLYRDEGFAVMKAEHDKFVTAVRTLKEAGYETDAQIQTLIDKQSEMESKLAQLSSDIRHFRYEIKLCNKALELNCHMQSKKDALQRMEHDEQNIVEPVR